MKLHVMEPTVRGVIRALNRKAWIRSYVYLRTRTLIQLDISYISFRNIFDKISFYTHLNSRLRRRSMLTYPPTPFELIWIFTTLCTVHKTENLGLDMLELAHGWLSRLPQFLFGIQYSKEYSLLPMYQLKPHGYCNLPRSKAVNITVRAKFRLY